MLEFMTAKHTYVNERVALLYGIESVKGERFQRVELEEFDALGLARQRRDSDGGGVSEPHVAGAARRIHPRAHHRHAARGAAAERRGSARGRRRPGKKFATVREKMIAHSVEPDVLLLPRHPRSSRLCAREFRRRRDVARARSLCWRRLDTSGSLPDGTELQGPDDLREALMRRPDQFVQTFTERLLTYALGPHVRLRGYARRCARSCGTRRSTTIGSRRSSAASWKASPSK